MPVEKIPLKDFRPDDEPEHIRDAPDSFARDRSPEDEEKAIKEREKRQQDK